MFYLYYLQLVNGQVLDLASNKASQVTCKYKFFLQVLVSASTRFKQVKYK